MRWSSWSAAGERRIDGPVANAARRRARPARVRLGWPVRLPRAVPPGRPQGLGPGVRERPAPRRGRRRRRGRRGDLAARTRPRSCRRRAMRDLYETLGVTKTASADEIKRGVPQARPEVAPRQQRGRRLGRGEVQGDHGRVRHAVRSREAQGVRPVRRRRRHGRGRRLRPVRLQRLRGPARRRPVRPALRPVRPRPRRRPVRRRPAGARARHRPADVRDAVVRRRADRRAADDPRLEGRHVPRLPRHPRGARHAPDHLPRVQGPRRAVAQPGLLLAVRSRACTAPAPARSSSAPARPARAAAASAARSATPSGSPPASRTAPASGCPAAAARGSRADRPATCSCSSTSRPRRCSSVAATTSWSTCR